MLSNIDTTRLALRPLEASDAPAICALGNEQKAQLWLPDWANTIDQVNAYNERMQNFNETLDPSEKPVLWAVTLSGSGKMIGYCGVAPKEELGGEVELFFAISAEHAGHGLATEAARAVIWWAMEQAGVHTLVAIVHPDNVAALRALHTLGFVQAGTRRLTRCGEAQNFLYLRYSHIDWSGSPVRQLPDTAEEMAAFFDKRAGSYEEHMKQKPDFDDFYSQVTAAIKPTTDAITVLDLGCGTGLELSWLFEKAPNAKVTCVDLSRGMLDILSERYTEKLGQIELVQASYADWEYPKATYDYVISVYTMHHFLEQCKLGIYRKILASLKPGGIYIEADYMVDDVVMEQYRRRYHKIMDSLDSTSGMYYHVDIPFTPWLQKRILQYCGFSEVTSQLERLTADWSGAIIVAKK